MNVADRYDRGRHQEGMRLLGGVMGSDECTSILMRERVLISD